MMLEPVINFVNLVKVLLVSMFDRSKPKNDVRVHSMFDELVFDPSLLLIILFWQHLYQTKIMKTEISAASGASLCIIALGEVETNIGKIPPMLP